jgi:hypothetical protein
MTLVCYDLMERLTNEEEDVIFETKPKMFSIGTLHSQKNNSLVNVRMSKIRSTKDSDLEQRTSN